MQQIEKHTHNFIGFFNDLIEGKEEYNAMALSTLEEKSVLFEKEIIAISDSSLDLKIQLSKLVQCVWKIDKYIEDDKNNKKEFLYILRTFVQEKYNYLVSKTGLAYKEANQHLIYDKAKFYDLVNEQKEIGFPLMEKSISLLANSDIPEQRKDFVGRRDKAIEILEYITSSAKESICVSGKIEGENGGLGKTTLAMEIAHFLATNKSMTYEDNLDLVKEYANLQNFFSDGCLWVRISSTEQDVHVLIKEIAQQIGYNYLPEREILENTDNSSNRDKEQDKYANQLGDLLGSDEKHDENFTKTDDYSTQEVVTKVVDSITKNKKREDKKEYIVRSLEEISLILHKKKVLLVIDNAEQNQKLFEYIFARLNTFVSILITSRYPTLGIDTIRLDNLNEKDSETLFLKSIVESKKEKLKCDNYSKNISLLCHKYLEGHPLSIHLAVNSKNLYKFGIIEFSKKLEKEMNTQKHKTYKKVLALLEIGEILNKDEKEALIRASANFNNDFTTDNIDGFCVHEHVKKSIKGLYAKSIIQKAEGDNTFTVQQVFKDYALKELTNLVCKNIKKYLDEEVDGDLLDFINKNIEKFNISQESNLNYQQRMEWVNDTISFLLANNNDYQTKRNINRIIEVYILNLDIYRSKHILLVKTLLDSEYSTYKNWLLYVLTNSYKNIGYYTKMSKEGTSNVRTFFLQKYKLSIKSTNGVYHKILRSMGFEIALEYSLPMIDTDFSGKRNMFLFFEDLLNTVSHFEKKYSLEKLEERGKILIGKLPPNEKFVESSFIDTIYTLKAGKNKTLISEEELSLLKSVGEKYGESDNSIRDGILYLGLLNAFNSKKYNEIIKEKFIFESIEDKRGMLVLKVLSLLSLHKQKEAKQMITSCLSNNKEAKFETLIILNYIKTLITNPKEQKKIIDILNLRSYLSTELNQNYNYWIDKNESEQLFIPSTRGFYNLDKMLLLDDSFMLDKMSDIFDGAYHSEIDNYDTGYMLYPYLIDKNPVTEQQYIDFCESTSKKYDADAFSIQDAIEYAESKGKKVATEEEWINAFRKVNYSTTVPQTIASLFEEKSKEVISYEEIINMTISQSNETDDIYKWLLPREIYSMISSAKNWQEIEKDINEIIKREEPTLNSISNKDLVGIPISLLILVGYSLNIYTPELKLQLLHKLRNSDKSFFTKAYRLLLLDISESYFLDKTQLLLHLVNQRNVWKIALKLFLGIDDYKESLVLTKQLEMVHKKEDEEDRAVYKISKSDDLHSTSSSKKGFVPFRCVQPLPFLSDKIQLS